MEDWQHHCRLDMGWTGQEGGMINIRNQVANKIELARGEDFPIKSFLSVP